MQPAYQSICESGGASSSGEDLHPGLIYTSAYYEEEQLYCDLTETSNECSRQKSSPCVTPAVEINEHSTINIDLPPILWHGYKTVPKILSLTNTGKTILINGQWVKGRPYIEGGPLNGTYIFSQIHFHSPSEHEIDGKRYPLEMHAVHYKTSYLTQERAMLERDGTVVLVYLFEVLDTPETDFSSVTKLAPKIEKVNSRTETTNVSLEQLVKPFTSNYYIYWGSVQTGKHSYLLQWIVNCDIVCVTKQEADELLAIMNLGESNVKSTPRVKPENDAIYYVEEVEQEEEEDKQHDCNACRSYQEWWLSHLSHTCPKYEDYDQAQVSSSNLQYCVSKKEDDCYSQPVLSSKKNLLPKNNYSGLRMCCHKIRKPTRKSCEPQTVTVCSTEDGKLCFSPGPGDPENCKEYQVVVTKETTSCPNTEATIELSVCPEKPLCEENKEDEDKEDKEDQEDKEVAKVKIVCSLPSANSSPKECDEESKVKIKKKKKSGSCKEVYRNTSKTENNKKKECKKKNQREDDFEVASSSRRSSSLKSEKKSSSPKRTRKSDPDCDASKSSSKVSIKKSRKRKSRDSQDICTEKEIPVECVVSTLTEKSFDEILREYDTGWLEDSSLKMSTKTESDDFCKVLDTGSLRTSSCDFDENTITTLFEKKQEPKVLKPPAEDCTVNFLLQPNSHKSNPSCSYMTPKSVSEELKCTENKVSDKSVNVPDVTVNTVTLSGVPTEDPNELPKEFCFQVELLFQANNKDFSECVTQEYNLALMYNQTILQEYRGTLCPKNLKIGNYEKLELLPKYPELDNISIRLQDCIVKMESSDQICVRAKFLMKELNFKHLDTVGEKDGDENTDKKILVLSDAVTQYSVKEFDKLTDFDILEKISLQAKVSELPQNSFSQKTMSLSSPVTALAAEIQLSKQSFETGSLKNEIFEEKKSEVPTNIREKEAGSEKTNCREMEASSHCLESEACKKSNFSEEENKTTNSLGGNSKNFSSLVETFGQIEGGGEKGEVEEAEEDGKKDTVGKEQSKKAAKKLKNIFLNRKKTVYFMYEKVEKDEKSGKKVFVGSFRSKEDVRQLPKEKKSDNEEEKKLLLLSLKDSGGTYDVVPVFNGNERELKTANPRQSKNLLNDKKDFVTLHKFKPKHLGVHESKKDHLNVLIGKSLNPLQKNSRNFKRVADLAGINQEENPKISVYELQESSENEARKKQSSAAEDKDNHTKRDPIIMLESKKVSNKNMKTKQSATESVKGRKVLTKKGSQSALIIIPVEVESLSKVEVILVEHSDGTKKTILKKGREVIPCFDSFP